LSVSPDSIKKDKRVTDDFMIKLVFEDYCGRCNKPFSQALDDFCDNCKRILSDDIVSWKTIQMVINRHNYPKFEDGINLH